MSLRRPLVLLLATTLVVLPACSKKHEKAAPRAGTTTAAPTSTAAGVPVIHLNLTGVENNGTADPDDATKAAVMATADTWVANAVVAPLHSGQPAGDLTPLLTTSAVAKMADPATRAAFVDEGLPAAASTSITADKADATINSVAGPDGTVGLVGVRVDLRLHAVGPDLDLDVIHWGEMILAQQDGAWRIDAFDLHASRDSRGAA